MFRTLFLVICTLFIVISAQCADKAIDLYDFTGGLMDRVSAERMPIKYTPDCANIALDSDLGVVRRKEYIDYNSTALTGLQAISSLYNYNQNDGDRYLIAQSSNSLFAGKTAGSLSVISSTFTANVRMSYETALDVLYGGNGTDSEWSWNGTTFTVYDVSNSTNMVKAKYHTWFQNRMFRAGVSGSPLTIYYSEINVTGAGSPDPNPADLGDGTNFEYIPQAGDIITGMAPAIGGGVLYIFTNNSTWALIGTGPTNWRLQNISPYIGCLYNSTIDYLNGSMVFLSARGLESFDGSNFTLLSAPIDNQIKSLTQLNSNTSALVQDSSSDWGYGSGTNIDTTTYSGSVAISSTNLIVDYNTSTDTIVNITGAIKGRAQSFKLSTSTSINAVSFYIKGNTGGSSVARLMITKDNIFGSGGVYFNSNITIPQNYDGEYIATIDPIVISTSSYYFISVTYVSGYSFWTLYGSATYASGDGWISSDGSSWSIDSTNDYYFKAYAFNRTGSYTTQNLNAGTQWGSWSNFASNDNVPSSSTINYYAITATSTYNLTTNTPFALTNGGVINSTVGPYIKVISSFTRTNSSVVPKINDITISYTGNNYNIPCGKTFQESYYLSVSTQSSTNNVVYRFNRNGIFELYNNMNFSDYVLYRGNLLAGDSTSTGKVYQLNIGSSWIDSIGNYTSYYYTPMMDCGSPLVDKSFKSLWITSSKDTVNFSISYSLDGSTTWNILTPTIGSTRINTQKLNFPSTTKGKYIQLKISSTQYFNVRGMTLIYEEIPLQ